MEQCISPMRSIHDENRGAGSVVESRICDFEKGCQKHIVNANVLQPKNLNDMHTSNPNQCCYRLLPPAPAVVKAYEQRHIPLFNDVIHPSEFPHAGGLTTTLPSFSITQKFTLPSKGSSATSLGNSSFPLLANGATLDLSCLGDGLRNGFDIGPLRTNHLECELYDNETIALEWKLYQILNVEQNPLRRYPRFVKERQMVEAADRSRWYHYPLYYILGMDTTGFFQLKEEFEWYQDHPWSSFDQDGVHIFEFDVPPSNTERLANVESCSECDDSCAQFSDVSVRSLDRYLP